MKPVIVAGAGPVGAVLALHLLQHGIPVVLLDKAAEVPLTLRASTFHPPTLDYLATLGVVDHLIGHGLKARTYQYRSRLSGEIAEFDLDVLREDTGYPYRLQVEQWRLTQHIHALLLRDFPIAQCRFGCEVRGIHQHGDGVQVLVWTGAAEELIEGSMVVGADGADSAVRKSLAIPFEGFTYPENYVVASTPFPLETKLPRLCHVNYITDPEEWVVMLRIPTLWRVMFPTDPAATDTSRYLSDEWLQEHLKRVAPHTSDYPIEHRTLYRVHQRVATVFRRGRVALAGDAAHVNNPFGGMGMNGGIHDAWNLAQRIVAVVGGADLDAEFGRYERQRRTICVDFVQAQTKANRNLMRDGAQSQQQRQTELMQIAADPSASRDYLLKASMIDSLAAAARIQ